MLKCLMIIMHQVSVKKMVIVTPGIIDKFLHNVMNIGEASPSIYSDWVNGG